MSSPGPWAEWLGRLAFEFAEWQPMLPTYLHLIISALFPIFAAAHASLSRPDTAAPPKKLSLDEANASGEDPNDEDEEENRMHVEGMTPSDAIMFPLLAGATLTGLYFLIKWLQDPAMLNKILGYYFGIMGVFGVYRLVADLLNVGHSFLFPAYFSSGGHLWRLDANNRQFHAPGKGGSSKQIRHSPLPGVLGSLPTFNFTRKMLWTIRELPSKKVTFSLYVVGLGSVSTTANIFDAMGLIVAISASITANLIKSPWWLTNLMGFAFSYSALQLLSPTTFGTANLVLGGLFFYDIVMVFYTPMMVTVAKSLDVPIKLVFPRPAAPGEDPSRIAHAMLGLGDVVLPGMVIGLALRFDLYQHYLRLQRPSKGTTKSDAPSVEKAHYVSPSKNWANHFWAAPLFSHRPATQKDPQLGNFRKTYFNAGLVGYVIGMVATLLGMHYSNHPQPALLYLVPGVLGSLWLTAAFRGEVSQMWHYTEASEEVEADEASTKNKEDKTDTGGTKEGKDSTDLDAAKTSSTGEQGKTADSTAPVASKNTDGKSAAEQRIANDLFVFSITRHRPAARRDAVAKPGATPKPDTPLIVERESVVKAGEGRSSKRAKIA